MNSYARQPLLLHRGRLLRIDAADGGWVACRRGSVWITLENDPVDRVLAAGERWDFDTGGLALVNALDGDAVVELSQTTAYRFTAIPGARQASARRDASRRSALAVAVAAIGPTVPSDAIAVMPPGPRRELLEREVRRMRARMLAVLARHARQAARDAVGYAVTRGAELVAAVRLRLRAISKLNLRTRSAA